MLIILLPLFETKQTSIGHFYHKLMVFFGNNPDNFVLIMNILKSTSFTSSHVSLMEEFGEVCCIHLCIITEHSSVLKEVLFKDLKTDFIH